MAPDDPVVLTYTSDVMYILGRYDEAIETLQRLATIQPWKEEYVRSRVDAFRIRAAREAAKLIETTPPTELELEAETTEPDSRHEDLR